MKRVSNTTQIVYSSTAVCDNAYGIPRPWPLTSLEPSVTIWRKTFLPTSVTHYGAISYSSYTQRLFFWPNYNCFTLNYKLRSAQCSSDRLLHGVTYTVSDKSPFHSDQHLEITWERFMAQELRNTALRSIFKIFRMHLSTFSKTPNTHTLHCLSEGPVCPPVRSSGGYQQHQWFTEKEQQAVPLFSM